MIAVALIIIGCLLLATTICKSGHRTSCSQKLAGFVGRELAMCLVIFTSINYAFCTCISALFDQGTSEFTLGMIVAGLAQLPLIYFLIMFFSKPERFSDTKTILKEDDKWCRSHPIVLIFQRSILGILFGISSLIPDSITIALPAFQFAYLLYFLIKRPYQACYLSVRGVFN